MKSKITRNLLRDVPQYLAGEIFSRNFIVTPIGIDEEYWLMLRSVSEVKQRGIGLLMSYGFARKDCNKNWKIFRSYIRQSENFWETAKNTSYESAALLYYYSFLNLVKAYLHLKHVGNLGKLYHGMSVDKKYLDTKNVRKMIVKSGDKSKGAMPLYYDAIFKNQTLTTISISDLLAYVPDIAYQYETGKFGKSKIMPAIYKIASDQSTSKAWSVIAIPKPISFDEISNDFPTFFDDFEIAEVGNQSDLWIRQMFGENWPGLNFFQSKESKMVNIKNVKSYPKVVMDNLIKIVGDRRDLNYSGDMYNLRLLFATNKKISFMNEDLAIYIVMFFMSDLVRYRPDVLYGLLESKSRWLLESFVISAPNSFLRNMTVRMLYPFLGNYVIINKQ